MGTTDHDGHGDHIPVERMRQAVIRCGAFLNEEEEAHLGHCRECLMLFSRIVLSDEDGLSSRSDSPDEDS